MTQNTSPLLSSYLSDKWDYYPQPKQVTLIVDFRPIKDIYQGDRFSHIQKLIDFYEFVEVVLSSNDTAYVWTLLDNQLDPSLGMDILDSYDEEINAFAAIVFTYMHHIRRHDSITSYQILKISDDLAQLRAFIGE